MIKDKDDLLLIFKKLRKTTRTTQSAVAEKMNILHKTNYKKGAICNYEKKETPATTDRLVDLLSCIGAKVHFLVEEPLNHKFNYFVDKMPQVDRDKLMVYIKTIHKDTKLEDLQMRLFMSNYINQYIDVIASKGKKVTFLFLEKGVNQRFDYEYK